MSTENPRVRPYKGLKGFEGLARVIRLTIVEPNFAKTTLEPGQSIHLPGAQLPKLGIQLEFPWEASALSDALATSHMPVDKLSVVVIAEDRFLKERTILNRFPVSIPEDAVKVALVNGTRPAALLNPVGGFELSVLLVLDEALHDQIAFRPHRKGTVLAQAGFTVRGQRDSEGLKPLPLTDVIRAKNSLPKGTMLFVESDVDLLAAEDLSVVSIYVHEDLLKRLDHARGPERVTVLRQLAIDAWVQLIYCAHDEMSDDYVWDGSGGVFLRTLLKLARSNRKTVTPSELVDLVTKSPRTLCALISGSMKQAERVMLAFDEASTETEKP